MMKTDPVEMWICEKYGVAMMAANARVFCARRFASANGRDGELTACGFVHCRACSRGAREYYLSSRSKERSADKVGETSDRTMSK